MNKFILFMSIKTKIVKEVVLDTAPAEGGRRGQQAYTMSSRNYITQIEWETKNTGIYESILSLQCWKSLSFMCQKHETCCFVSLLRQQLVFWSKTVDVNWTIKNPGENKNSKTSSFVSWEDQNFLNVFAIMSQKRPISRKLKMLRGSYLVWKTPNQTNRAPDPGYPIRNEMAAKELYP